MALTPKQRAVLEFCQKNGGQITKEQAMQLIDTHYAHGAKHVGDCIGRMIKSGLLIRVKRGVFQAGTGKKNKPANLEDRQIKMEL